MRVPALLATLVSLTALLAGCADPAPPAEDTDAVDFKEFDLGASAKTGVIRGVVVDEAIVPIADVTVTLGDTGRTVVTTENGAFGFGDVPPATYFLTAEKAGYQPVQQSIVVVAGIEDPPVAKMLMSRDASTLPYAETVIFSARVGCSVTVPVISATACGINPLPEYTNHVTQVDYGYPIIPTFVQSEMHWQSTQTVSDRLQLTWDDLSGGGQVDIASNSGTSPVIVGWDGNILVEKEMVGHDVSMRVFGSHIEGTDVVPQGQVYGTYNSSVYPTYNGTAGGTVGGAYPEDCFLVACTYNPVGEDCVQHVTIFEDSCINFRGTGFTIDQEVEVLTTNFYNFYPDDGWTLLADGPHPSPSQ